jgi:hypothetical protein
LVVAVNPDAEIHLARIRIGVERFGDAEDRITGRHFYRGKERRRIRSVHCWHSREESAFYHVGSPPRTAPVICSTTPGEIADPVGTGGQQIR